jgi:hypothetical protein
LDPSGRVFVPTKKDEEETKSKVSIIRAERRMDWGHAVRHMLAVLIVVFTFAIVWYAYDKNGLEDAKELWALLSALMGAVSGYYFGAKDVDTAVKEANIARAERDSYAFEARSVDDAQAQLEEAKATIGKLKAYVIAQKTKKAKEPRGGLQ